VDVSSSDTDVYEDVNDLSLDKLEVGVVVEVNVNTDDVLLVLVGGGAVVIDELHGLQ